MFFPQNLIMAKENTQANMRRRDYQTRSTQRASSLRRRGFGVANEVGLEQGRSSARSRGAEDRICVYRLLTAHNFY